MLEINEMNLCVDPYSYSTIHMDLTVTDVTGNNRKVYEDALDSARYLNSVAARNYMARQILASELEVDAEERIGATAVIKTERTKVIIARTLTDTIEKVIFNNPATIVYWKDGTKTVVKANGEDVFDKEVGLAMAIAKKALGNEGNYYETFKQWIPQLDR
ncbi:MAG: hypothetical protein MJZ20_01330 [Bacteroidaceae bacterium]|nr:hypothetical protein [Bacteroidaceae bacterium]